jgi:hypothetical protein
MLLSLLIAWTPRAFAFLIAAVTVPADTSASGAMPPNRVPSVPRLTAPLLPYRVEAPAKQPRSQSPLASTNAFASNWCSPEWSAKRSRATALSSRSAPKTKACSRMSTQGALGCFRIEYHEDAAVARGRRHCAPAAQLGQDFVRNAGHGLTRLLTQCVESAIGQHIAHRPGAAQASGGFNQADACAGSGCANRSPDACSASTNNENVICVFHNHSFVLDGDPGIYWHCQEPSPACPTEKGACPPFSFRES